MHQFFCTLHPIPSDTVLKWSNRHSFRFFYQIVKASTEASYELFCCYRFKCFALFFQFLCSCSVQLFIYCLVQFFILRLVQLFRSHSYSYLPHFSVCFFLTNVFFLLWYCTITIDGNVCNGLKCWNVMFCIGYKLLLANINISLHVLLLIYYRLV